MSLFATDEGGFKSIGKATSHLSGLFDSNEPSTSSSFTYHAPIQPKKSSSAAASSSQDMSDMNVLFAVRVQGHKFDATAKKYNPIGKIGAAILGSKESGAFQVLLYHSNDNHVCAANISPTFKFTVQRETFGSFYDQKQNYSIQFASLDDCNKFVMHIALAKHIVSGAEFTAHDIATGSGQALSVGDVAGVGYSGYVETGAKLGDMFDSNAEKGKPFRVNIGDGAVIKGWTQGLTGMKKGGRRAIVCSPSLAYGSNGVPGKVPANATLVFHLHAQRVKFSSKSGGSSSPAPAPAPPVPEEAAFSPAPQEASAKDDVIDRMRKIGQQAMPSPGYEGYDSPQARQPGMPGQQAGFQQGMNSMGNQYGPGGPNQGFNQGFNQGSPYQQQQQMQGQGQFGGMGGPMGPMGGPMGGQMGGQMGAQQGYGQFGQQPQMPYGQGQNQLALFNSAQAPYGQQPAQPQQPQAPAQPQQPQVIVVPAAPAAAKEEPEAPVQDAPSKADNIRFLHEARQLHDDLKTTVVGACTKIEHLSGKIQHSVFGRDEEVSKDRVSGIVLVQTIQKIVEDNEMLQKEVNLKSERIDELREKLASLYDKNKKLIEEHSTAMEERNDSLTANTDRTMKKLQEARDEKLRLEEELNKNAEALSKARRELSRLNLSYSELTAQYKEAQDEVNSLRAEVNESKTNTMAGESKSSELQLQLKEERSAHKSSKGLIDTLKEELSESKDTYSKLKKVAEERRKKWIQLKAQIDKNHEEEKIAAVKKMKAQLLKFKKARDAAVADAETTEKEVEDKWKAIVAKAKEQFAERIAEIEHNAAEDRQRAVDEAFARGKRDGNKAMRDAKSSLEDAYKKGFVQGRAEGAAQAKGKRVRQLESQLERSRTDSMSNTVASLKKIMSSIYFQLTKEFEVAETYEGGSVVEQLAETIRSQTFIAVKQLESELAEVEDELEEEDDDDEIDDDMDDMDIEEQIAEFHKVEPAPEEVVVAAPRSAPAAAPVAKAVVAVAEEDDEEVEVDDLEDPEEIDEELESALAEVLEPVNDPIDAEDGDYEDFDDAVEAEDEAPAAEEADEAEAEDDSPDAEAAEEVQPDALEQEDEEEQPVAEAEAEAEAEEEEDDEDEFGDEGEADDVELADDDDEEEEDDAEAEAEEEEADADEEPEAEVDDDEVEAEEEETAEVEEEELEEEVEEEEEEEVEVEVEVEVDEEEDDAEEAEADADADDADADDADAGEDEYDDDEEEEDATGQLMEEVAEPPAPAAMDDIFGGAPAAKAAPVNTDIDIFGGGGDSGGDDLFGASKATAPKKSSSKVDVNDLFGGGGGGDFFEAPAKKAPAKSGSTGALDDIFGGAPAKTSGKKADLDDIFSF